MKPPLRLLLLAFAAQAMGGALPAIRPTKTPAVNDTLPAVLSLDAIPLGLDHQRPIPRDNPLTEAKVRLGRRLFFDPVLSGDRSLACASCHQPAHAFSSADRVPSGIGGRRLARRAPTLLNRAYGTAFFWDGREPTLEAQALRPITSPTEMGARLEDVLGRLRSDRSYRDEFRAAFADGITAANLARGIASFERVLLTGESPVDRFRAGQVSALDEKERHGLWLFESRGRCWRCHAGPNFTDEAFHNTGVSWGQPTGDLGRYGWTKKEEDRGRFKTPTLRALTDRAPYMHDGSLNTLEEVVDFYNQGARPNPHLDPAIAPLGLTREEVQDLVAFLRALSRR